MRQTEKLIRKVVSEILLHEAAKRPADLFSISEDISVIVITNDNPNEIEVTIEATDIDDDGVEETTRIGVIRLGETSDDLLRGGGKCAGALEVKWSRADFGFGPLIYDIGMEVASLKGLSIMSDRDEVSDSARRVWDFYDSQRSDVEKIQLDNERGELTPDDENDDCSQFMSRTLQSDTGEKWHKHSLSRAFRKRETPILDELRKLRILRMIKM
jgi:hypothetical protein